MQGQTMAVCDEMCFFPLISNYLIPSSCVTPIQCEASCKDYSPFTIHLSHK